MFNLLASLLTGAAGLVSNSACSLFFLDEPKCPKSLIK